MASLWLRSSPMSRSIRPMLHSSTTLYTQRTSSYKITPLLSVFSAFSQQHRNYWFLPTSWTELKLRLQSVGEKRTIQVRLLKDRFKQAAIGRYAKAKDRYTAAKEQSKAAMLSADDQRRQWIHRRHGSFVRRRQASRLRWRRRSATLQSNVLKSQQRVKDWLYRYRTKRVELQEYAEPTWFDPVGRPRTTTDETGRYVNPWQSQSTAGVHSLASILRWRYERLKREWNEFQWQAFLPAELRPSRKPKETFASMAKLASRQTNLDYPFRTGYRAPSDPHAMRLTWLGHATCLLESENIRILTDPMFGERCGPWRHVPVGMCRDVPPACEVADLPSIDVCLVSHDHYDHLCKESCRQLRNKVNRWIVPLGVGEWLQERCGIEGRSITELEWWESVRLRQVRYGWKAMEFTTPADRPVHPALEEPTEEGDMWITCLPVQHWAGRTFFDRNFRLWCSFAVFFSSSNFYFGGDAALPSRFPLYEQVNDYIGAVDLAALPIGAYQPEFFMRDAHMDPMEAVDVHQRLQSRTSVGMHWGTFPLSEEPMMEPPLLLKQAADAAGVDFVTIPHGAALSVAHQEVEGDAYAWIVE